MENQLAILWKVLNKAVSQGGFAVEEVTRMNNAYYDIKNEINSLKKSNDELIDLVNTPDRKKKQ